jgi:rhodanese-related sulfurtransferase
MLLLWTTAALAEDAVPVTAMEAFDAYVQQVDPLTGEAATVAIVDVRTAAEHYWVGAPAMVASMVTVDGEEIFPYLGKVISLRRGRFLKYYEEHRGFICPRFIRVRDIEEVNSVPISILVSYENWNDVESGKTLNVEFGKQMEALAEDGFDVVILMCRSGKRSSNATDEFNTEVFSAVYEIDQPDDKNGRGGFEGTSYEDGYNGYRGYPGRRTKMQEHPSVSWKDAGLPMHIGWTGKEEENSELITPL